VATKAEIRVANENHEMPKVASKPIKSKEEAKKDSLLQVSNKAWDFQYLYFRFLISRTV
jgi:hypothetical protein